MEEVNIFQQIENDHISSQQGGSATPGSTWHPNILKFYNWYETRNHFWIILEHCSGGDLYSLIEQDKKLPECSVKKLAYELLEGLSYLHSQGIIFGDLKPSNVLINEYCNLKLCDFSLAKKVTDLSNISIKSTAEERTSSHSNSSSKNKAGTPYYMAPELFQDNGVYSYYSDFWSLGCIMIEMATGKPPFYTNSLKELIQKIIVEEVKPVDTFSDEFNDLVSKMLQKDPICRVNWEEIKRHPWWQSPLELQPNLKTFDSMNKKTYTFTKRIYQPQLHFDKYLQNIRKIDPIAFSQLRNQKAEQMSTLAMNQNNNQNVDLMRISYNVMRNMQEQEALNKYTKSDQVGASNLQANANQKPQAASQMPSTPVVTKPHVQTQNEEFDQYNSKVLNRNSKLNKNQQQEIDDLEEDQSNSKAKDNIDFYGNQKKPISRGSSSSAMQVDKYDYNLGKNTKMVLDFTAQEGNAQDKQKQASSSKNKQTISQTKSSSPIPNFQQTKGATTRNITKQNNYFNTQTQEETKINTLKQSPSPKAVSSLKPAGFQLSNQKVSQFQLNQLNPPSETPKQDQIRTKSPLVKPVEKTVNLKEIAQTPIIPPQNIDRMQLLNDHFDQFEDFEDDFQETQSQHDVSKSFNGLKISPYQYHKPMDEEQAHSCLLMIKDMKMFDSILSQTQIKQEIQLLVSQTVQIGPVQNQGQSQSSLGGSSNFTNLSNNKTQADTTNWHYAQKSQTMRTDANGLSLGNQTPTQMKVPHKTIEQLIIHNSDTAVKPIVGNKEIEKIQESSFNNQHLQFVPWTSEEVLANINTSEIDNHLSQVYTSMASNTTINEKISTLQYFESIIINSNVSNSLINSVFMALLKRMLEQIKSSMIKIRVCSVVGLLIRHSTMIDNELAEIDIASQLIETLRDNNEKVRRRAIAALGEYMFYAATQLDDEMADPVWEMSDDAINIIVSSLDENETDRIVRFYACKTLENICAQSTLAGHRFANLNTVKQVINIYLMKFDPQIKNSEEDAQSIIAWYEGIRISAAIALSHICKLNPQLFPIIFETITPSKFCEILMEGSSTQYRVQQAFITMLNLALHNIYYPQISSILLKEKNFLKALLKLIEHQHIVIRGKCILTFLLLFKLDFRWITVVQNEIKFFNELDKLLCDNYKYVQCCLLCLADGIQEIMPTIFKTICEQLLVNIESLKSDGQNESKIELDVDVSNLEFIGSSNGVTEFGDFSELSTSQLFHISILLDLQINTLIRSRVLSTPMIQAFSSMLDICDQNSFKGAEQFLNAMLIFCEKFSCNQKALQILAQPVLSVLLPVLFNKLTNSQSMDIKILSFKIYTDILTQYISDSSLYQIDQSQSQISMLIDKELYQSLLPSLIYILTSENSIDPIPMFGLRLLNAIIERMGVTDKLKQYFLVDGQNTLVQILASFYIVGHSRLNRHTLQIMQAHLNCKQITLDEMISLGILKNTHELMSSMLKNRQEWCLEMMLDILNDLLNHFKDLVKNQEDQIVEHINEIFNNFDNCNQLLSLTFDSRIVEKASLCLIQMLQLFAQSQMKKRDIYFVESHFPFLLSAIKSDKLLIQKRVLKCIYWALIQSEYDVHLTKDIIFTLENQMEQMVNSKDRSIAQTSREVYKLLTQQRQAAIQKDLESEETHQIQQSAFGYLRK